MNKATRIQKIAEILQTEPLGHQEIVWQDNLQSMPVYKIPLNVLVYNKYNGRILSRSKSIEQQYGENSIDVETDQGKQIVEKLLWDSKPDRNKKTKKDIAEYGQKKVGIITRDGIIIDGNRRAMLLNKINTYDYFKAIILPIALDENPIEIEKLETSYQMGEDEKLGYNPVEKYLKSKQLFLKLKEDNDDSESVEKIAKWMGETETTIKEYLAVMDTMDDYLDYLDYNGIYTQLDDREDHFISLTKWLTVFYGEGSARGFDGYTNNDVDDLKSIAYDYIRVKYEGKQFRLIAAGLKANHFFGNREIWVSFKDA